MMHAVYLIALWVVGADSLVIQEQVPRWQVYRNGMQATLLENALSLRFACSRSSTLTGYSIGCDRWPK